jgi:hypothetical protein
MALSWSICYTAITLLGVNKARINGWQGTSFIDQSKTLSLLVSNWKRAKQFGHLGLIQWVNAECMGQYEKDLTDEISRRSSADNLLRLPSTELAWLLTGFCATYQNLCFDDTIKELAALYYKAISDNFNPQTGLFCHMKKEGGPAVLRSQIGNFADQIYAIFALSTYYEIFNDKHALQVALQCANSLCTLQGNLGQWWWHYHARRGIVVSGYPVFAVHQYGMGPMGLQKLASVSGKNFQLPISKGLNWLFSNNELGLEMVDWKNHVIWRDIQRTPLASITRYLSMLLAEAGWTSPIRFLDSTYSLKVNHEMRPYELGWLLYAFSDECES